MYEFACPEPAEVNLSLHSGVVTLTAVDEPVASVEIEPEDGSEASQAAADQAEVTMNGKRLEVHVPWVGSAGWLGFRRGRLRVTIRVPVGSDLTARLGSADLRTAGRLGSINANTGSGDVVVAETNGDLNAETGSGDVRVGLIGGILRAHTSSGDVTADAVNGDVVVQASSGDVLLGSVLGTLRVHTASGDVRVKTVRGKDAGVDVASGDVTVGVPEGTSVWLDLASNSGSTRSELTPSDEPTGGPALSLRVHSRSGDIRVHRAAA